MFDEWWEENWTEQEFAGCKKCTETAFKAGMLAAADIAWEYSRGIRPRTQSGVMPLLDEVAEAIRGAGNES